jgi:MFS family permease
LRSVFANPGLRRIQLAFFGSGMGDWAYATAVTVWAFQEGGATAVGAFQATRFIVMAVAGPLGATIADRVSRRSFMMVLDAIRVVLVSSAAIVVGTGGPAWAVYALALLAAVVGAPFRSAQAGLVPQLATNPQELTASNAVASNLENVVIFAGPALGALLVALFDVQTAFWFNVASYLWSLSLLAGLHVPARARPAAADDHEQASFLREAVEGFVVVAKDADLRTTALLGGTQGLLFGAITVFNVLIALEMLGTGPGGVGLLMSLFGIGGIVGALIVLARVTRGSVAVDMVIGVLGWAVPFLLLAAVPSLPTAVLALLLVGLMDPWVNLGLDTLPQRLASERVMSRVFASVDAVLIGSMSLGSVLAPVLLHFVGLRGSLLVLGTGAAAYTVTTLPRMRRLDERLQAPEHSDLLARIPIFAPLASSAVESLASSLQTRMVPAGTDVVVEGEASHEFFVVLHGEVAVTQGGVLLRHETDGEVFGEIGLLRDVPRTATVTAVTDTELLVLSRVPFLETVSGTNESLRAAEDLATRRLGF